MFDVLLQWKHSFHPLLFLALSSTNRDYNQHSTTPKKQTTTTTTTTTISTLNNNNYTQQTKRGGRFRQTGMFGSNIIVGTVLGILSGKYIFEEPLQRYWAEKRAEEIAAAAANGGGGEVGALPSSSSEGSAGGGKQ